MKPIRLVVSTLAVLLFAACSQPTSPGAPDTEGSTTVFFDGNGADGGTAVANQAALPSQSLTLPANSWTKTGHEFAGWQLTYSTSPDFAVTKQAGEAWVMPESGTVTIKALWTVVSYVVTYDLAGGSPASGFQLYYESKSYPYGSEVSTTVSPTPPSGKIFLSWTVVYPDGSTESKEQNGGLFVMPAGDVTIRATYINSSIIVGIPRDYPR